MNLEDAYTEFLTNQVSPPPAPAVPDPMAVQQPIMPEAGVQSGVPYTLDEATNQTVSVPFPMAMQQTTSAPTPKQEPGTKEDYTPFDYLNDLVVNLGEFRNGPIRGALSGIGEALHMAGAVDNEQIKIFRDFMGDLNQLAIDQGANPMLVDFTEEVGKILPAAIPAFKALRLVPLMTRPVAAVLAEGIGGAVGFNPNDPNLGNMISGMIGNDKQGPLSKAIRMMATNPDDPELLNRARNFAEIAGIGTFFEGAFAAIQRAPDAGRAVFNWFNDTAKSAQQGTAFTGIPLRPDMSGSTLKPMKDVSTAPTELAPVFYSAVSNAVDNLPMEKGNAQQMRAMIAKSPEVKAEEMAWIGLDDFLKGKKSVTKQEIKEFVDTNQVRFEEVIKSESLGSARELQILRGYDVEVHQDPDGGMVAFSIGDDWDHFLSADDLTDEGVPLEAVNIARGIERGTETKFIDYTLPGGENYREVLLTLPTKTSVELRDDGKYWINNADGSSSMFGFDTREDAERLIRNVNANTPRKSQSGVFHGGHFFEPNVLAHFRLNDRIGPNDERILFIEEIQSDWHQKGRNVGYASESDTVTKALQAESDAIINRATIDPATGGMTIKPEDLPRYNELQPLIQERRPVRPDSVPDAPLKKTWHEMSFRRIARMAAEEGYDAIAWTPGKLQAERYDLSKQIDELFVAYGEPGTVNVSGTKDGKNVLRNTAVELSKLDELVGKDIADKIRKHVNENPPNEIVARAERRIQEIQDATGGNVTGNGTPEQIREWAALNMSIGGAAPEPLTLSGIDLQVGGKGMEEFYDKMLKRYADKWGKKFKSKVGTIEVNDKKVWTMPVTKEMRDSVLSKGVATFGTAGVAVGLNSEAENGN